MTDEETENLNEDTQEAQAVEEPETVEELRAEFASEKIIKADDPKTDRPTTTEPEED